MTTESVEIKRPALMDGEQFAADMESMCAEVELSVLRIGIDHCRNMFYRWKEGKKVWVVGPRNYINEDGGSTPEGGASTVPGACLPSNKYVRTDLPRVVVKAPIVPLEWQDGESILKHPQVDIRDDHTVVTLNNRIVTARANKDLSETDAVRACLELAARTLYPILTCYDDDPDVRYIFLEPPTIVAKVEAYMLEVFGYMTGLAYKLKEVPDACGRSENKA